MNSDFFLILRNCEFEDEALPGKVFTAGFDDSELTMRGDHPAIWICHRPGELTSVVREALEQARRGGLEVSHVEMENEVFA